MEDKKQESLPQLRINHNTSNAKQLRKNRVVTRITSQDSNKKYAWLISALAFAKVDNLKKVRELLENKKLSSEVIASVIRQPHQVRGTTPLYWALRSYSLSNSSEVKQELKSIVIMLMQQLNLSEDVAAGRSEKSLIDEGLSWLIFAIYSDDVEILDETYKLLKKGNISRDVLVSAVAAKGHLSEGNTPLYCAMFRFCCIKETSIKERHKKISIGLIHQLEDSENFLEGICEQGPYKGDSWLSNAICSDDYEILDEVYQLLKNKKVSPKLMASAITVKGDEDNGKTPLSLAMHNFHRHFTEESSIKAKNKEIAIELMQQLPESEIILEGQIEQGSDAGNSWFSDAICSEDGEILDETCKLLMSLAMHNFHRHFTEESSIKAKNKEIAIELMQQLPESEIILEGQIEQGSDAGNSWFSDAICSEDGEILDETCKLLKNKKVSLQVMSLMVSEKENKNVGTTPLFWAMSYFNLRDEEPFGEKYKEIAIALMHQLAENEVFLEGRIEQGSDAGNSWLVEAINSDDGDILAEVSKLLKNRKVSPEMMALAFTGEGDFRGITPLYQALINYNTSDDLGKIEEELKSIAILLMQQLAESKNSLEGRIEQGSDAGDSWLIEAIRSYDDDIIYEVSQLLKNKRISPKIMASIITSAEDEGTTALYWAMENFSAMEPTSSDNYKEIAIELMRHLAEAGFFLEGQLELGIKAGHSWLIAAIDSEDDDILNEVNQFLKNKKIPLKIIESYGAKSPLCSALYNMDGRNKFYGRQKTIAMQLIDQGTIDSLELSLDYGKQGISGKVMRGILLFLVSLVKAGDNELLKAVFRRKITQADEGNKASIYRRLIKIANRMENESNNEDCYYKNACYVLGCAFQECGCIEEACNLLDKVAKPNDIEFNDAQFRLGIEYYGRASMQSQQPSIESGLSDEGMSDVENTGRQAAEYFINAGEPGKPMLQRILHGHYYGKTGKPTGIIVPKPGSKNYDRDFDPVSYSDALFDRIKKKKELERKDKALKEKDDEIVRLKKKLARYESDNDQTNDFHISEQQRKRKFNSISTPYCKHQQTVNDNLDSKDVMHAPAIKRQKIIKTADADFSCDKSSSSSMQLLPYKDRDVNIESGTNRQQGNNKRVRKEEISNSDLAGNQGIYSTRFLVSNKRQKSPLGKVSSVTDCNHDGEHCPRLQS